MKKYIKIMIGFFATALITAGCEPLMYAQDDTAGAVNNGYNYDNGYGDPPPADDQAGNTYDYGSQDGNAQPPSGEPQITYNDFNTQLSPYGQWATDPTYGQVWVPNVEGFQPYSTNGYWTYTNYGWTWVSNYSWGWAPFHYGRWGSGPRGWFWIPGYTWGPAWVSWSSGADMYGWAPLGPGMSLGVSISIGSIPANYWTFMPSRYMGNRNINSYYVDRSRNVTIIRNTTIINNYGNAGNNRRYSMGPRVADVEKVSGRKITPARVVSTRNVKNTGVSNNEVRMYRPAVRTGNATNKNGAASRNTTNRANNTRTNNSQSQNRTTTQPATQRTYQPTQRTQPVQQQRQPVQPVQQQPIQRQSPAQRTQPQTQRSQPVQRQRPAAPARSYTQEQRTYSPPQRTQQPRTTAPARSQVQRPAQRGSRR